MLNVLWLLMVAMAMVVGAVGGTLDAVTKASIESANQAVTLAFGLVGAMVLWLGLVKVLHAAGVMRGLARLLTPVFALLFPELRPGDPALATMVLNMTSNMLGLGNAATPFGLAAMRQLNRHNPHPGVATNPMVVFLAINTSGLAVFPTGMIALRAALGAEAPGSIFVPTLLSTFSAGVTGVLLARLLSGLPAYALPVGGAAPLATAPGAGGAAAAPADTDVPDAQADAHVPDANLLAPRPGQAWQGWVLCLAVFGAFAYATYQLTVRPDRPLSWAHALRHAAGAWSLLALMAAFLCVGVGRGVKIYDAVVIGGREGFAVAVRILPYLVAILVAVGMLRASGAIDLMVRLLAPYTALIGMPAEALPMALLRPLTGYGAYGIAADTMRAVGPDSLAGEVVSTIMGTTETTFYVLALYLGSVGIQNARHAILTCVLADVVGTLAAVWSCRLLLH